MASIVIKNDDGKVIYSSKNIGQFTVVADEGNGRRIFVNADETFIAYAICKLQATFNAYSEVG